MSESVPSVSVFDIGAASGFLGAGVGYILAPRKYDLEQLLTQPQDVFEKSVSKATVQRMGNSYKKAYAKIEEARDVYLKAVENNAGDAKLVELTRATALESSYNTIKSLIPKAKASSAIAVGSVAAFIATAVSYVTSPRN